MNIKHIKLLMWTHTISPGKLPNPAKHKTVDKSIKAPNNKYHIFHFTRTYVLAKKMFFPFFFFFLTPNLSRKVYVEVSCSRKDTFPFGVPSDRVIWACSQLE